MATILITWELGAGLGHMARLQPIAQRLAQRGHRIYAALKDLSRAPSIFDPKTVSFLQAPIKTAPPKDAIRPAYTFAQILHNIGFANPPELYAMAAAWRNLFQLVRPDLVLLDHSPTALLAAHGLNMKRAVIGSGFFCPPDLDPLPNLRPWAKADEGRVRLGERKVLETINGRLQEWDQPPLQRITQLYSSVTEKFLVTFRELDHYPQRQGGSYWGAWTKVEGVPPEWPDEPNSRRIFCYFKKFKTLPAVLELLAASGCSVLGYIEGADEELRKRFNNRSMRIVARPLDLARVGSECDLAVLNGNHGTTISLLFAGKPTLHLPIFLEQALFARAVKRLGAGLDASFTQPLQVVERLRMLLSSPKYALAARQFAERNANFNPDQQADRMVRRIEQLASGVQ